MRVHRLPGLAALWILAIVAAACAGSPRYRVESAAAVWTGKASYYHDRFHGRPTASGEIYDRNALTAAHRSLAFGTVLRVRNPQNGRTVRVVVNDRGPFVAGRVLDLSRRAAEELDFVHEGVVEVEIVILDAPG